MPVNITQAQNVNGVISAINPNTGQMEQLFADPFIAQDGSTVDYQTLYFADEAPPGAIGMWQGQEGTALRNFLLSAGAVAGGAALAPAGAGAAGASTGLGAGELAAAEGATELLGGAGADALGGGFTGGFTGTAAGAPGFTGAAAGSPGLAAASGGGTLAPGFFAAESLYPVAGGLSAASVPAALAPNEGIFGPTGPGTGLGTLGTLGATALGVIGANNAANAYGDLSGQLREDRLPFLNQSVDWLNNPQAYFEGPGQAALQGNLRALSIYGNPAGNPWAIETANEAALRDYRNAVLGFGNLGLGGQGIQAQLGGQEINAETGAWNAVGGGIANMTNPQPTLEQLLAQIRRAGGSSVSL